MDKGSYNIKFKNLKNKPDGKTITKWVIWGLVVVLAGVLLFTSVYTVGDKERAVITTFGKVTSITDAGIHFKLPFGIQKAEYVNVEEIQKIEIGYRSVQTPGEDYKVVENESKMITGDYNIVNIDFFVEFRISDPVKYLYSSEEPEKILKMLIQSQIRNVVGSYEIDPILTESKDEIQGKILELSRNELAEYDIGLSIVNIRIQDSEPPTAEVNQAFMAVINADTGAKTAVNNANAYKNKKEAETQAEVNKILQNAAFLKEKRVNEAEQEVALFNARFEEYLKNPDITRARMYYETIEAVFPGAKIFIDTTDGTGIQKLLPLDQLYGGKGE